MYGKFIGRKVEVASHDHRLFGTLKAVRDKYIELHTIEHEASTGEQIVYETRINTEKINYISARAVDNDV